MGDLRDTEAAIRKYTRTEDLVTIPKKLSYIALSVLSASALGTGLQQELVELLPIDYSRVALSNFCALIIIIIIERT
jgi:hypothetical protein